MIAAVVVAGNGCCQFGASVGQVIAAAQTEESSFIMVVFWWHRADLSAPSGSSDITGRTTFDRTVK
jgi:hypothetical protein